MPPTVKLAPLAYTTVDDVLGPRRTRFFGEGFKRVGHHLQDIAIQPDSDAGLVTATAGLRMPRNWSRKGTAEQPPHLSTIDVMLFGAQLAGLYLAHTHGLSARDGFTVHSAVLKAGKDPQESGLDRFDIGASHIGTEPHGRHHRSTFDCRVGTLAMRLAVDHGGSPTALRSAGRYGSPGELAGPWNDAPFGADHRDRVQLLSDVEVDPDALTATADLALAGRAAGPGPTMIDLFVSALQLGQVLLYGLDGLDRATSDTLWMRRTVITPTGGDGAAGRFRVGLEAERLLDTAAGTWRGADVVAAHAGLELRCTVAHLLPGDH